MAVDLLFENKYLTALDVSTENFNYSNARRLVSSLTNIPEDDLYATQNGRPLTSTSLVSEGVIRWSCRLVGGKGGFGSMLRAIGAQIEKTTNREACRDLSGRRLRDIRQEQRLREWAANRQNREEEQRRRKEERLKRMCAIPSHEFSDAAYEEARKNLEEKADESLEVGMKAAVPSAQPSQTKPAVKKKKPKLWIDEDLSDMSSDESGCEEDEEVKRKLPVPGSSDVVSVKGKGVGKKSNPSEADAQSSRTATTSSDDGIMTDGNTTESSNDSDQDKKNGG